MTAKQKIRPHDEAMLEMFQRDPRTFVSYVWESLHEQDKRIDSLEKQCAVLKEFVHQQWHPSANPPAVPVTARDSFDPPQYHDHMGNVFIPSNPWMNQKWSSGATPEMFGMKEKKP